MAITETINNDQLVEQYSKLVSAICRRMIQDEHLAEDAAQEAWLKIIKGLPSFQGKSKLSTWIYTITTRVVIDFSKKEKLYSIKNLQDIFHGPQREVPYLDEFENNLWIKEKCDNCLTGILHCLNNEARLIYIFRKIIKLNYREISMIFNKEEPAIRKIYSRSRIKINNFLNRNCFLYNPQGKCQCRSIKLVKNINLQKEYGKIRTIIHKINFFRNSEKIFPRKNYWLNFL